MSYFEENLLFLQHLVKMCYRLQSVTTFSYNQIEGDEMGRLCSMHGRDEKCIQYFGWKA